MNKPSYQLTQYPIGTIREIWTISWPLILSLFSMSLMLFTDRLLLSRYSLVDLNSAASAGTASWMFLVLPISIVAISEVFVGRYHGEERHSELGKPVWQMIWFSVMMIPLFWMIALVLPFFLFYDSPNIIGETTYFRTILLFSPSIFINIAVAGFFIGSGRVKVVTICAVVANIMNISLDLLLINGFWGFPELGIFGAALGTGIAETFQCLCLFFFFLEKRHRIKFGTTQWTFDKSLFLESLRIGFPAGLGVAVEVTAHFIFFKIIGYSGQENLTVAALVQSLYFLVFFLFEGLSKGVTTVCANLLGGKQVHYIKKVLFSAGVIQTLFFIIVSAMFLIYSESIIDSFLNQNDETILASPKFLKLIKIGIFWMCLFFLFDGYTRILAGQLTASGDTRFLLYAGTVLNISAYILPTVLLIFVAGGGADDAWMILFCYSVTTFIVYYLRYASKRWVTVSDTMSSRL